MIPKTLIEIPTVNELLTKAGHVDVKTSVGDVSFEEFIAGFYSYYPNWIKFLYRVRAVFVRFLGMRQAGVPTIHTMKPEDVPMQTGEYITFFKIYDVERGHYHLAGIKDGHLDAYIAIVAEPMGGKTRYHAATIVHFNNRVGPIYFNVIRPFHHLVVKGMMHYGQTLYAPA